MSNLLEIYLHFKVMLHKIAFFLISYSYFSESVIMLCVWPEVILASAQFQYSSYPWFRAYTCVLESIHF